MRSREKRCFTRDTCALLVGSLIDVIGGPTSLQMSPEITEQNVTFLDLIILISFKSINV